MAEGTYGRAAHRSGGADFADRGPAAPPTGSSGRPATAGQDGGPDAGRTDIGVAIGIPEPYRTELQDWRERLGDPNATFIVPHVTLLGPTSVGRVDLPAIESHLAGTARTAAPFTIRLHGSGTFRPLSPVVFVALTLGISRCATLAAAVRSGPLDRPIAFEYHPHVTVAHDIAEDGLDRAFDALADYDAQFPVAGFGLYERGADLRWRQLRFFPFGRAEERTEPEDGGGRHATLGSRE